MTLGFRQQFPWGEPTKFREKILAGVGYVWGASAGNVVTYDALVHATSTPMKPKVHSIRSGFRWRPGMSIQMAYGVRTKNYQQFNKDVPGLQKCLNVQKIDMKLDKGCLLVTVNIDGRYLGLGEIEKLAINDGFNDVNDFFNWFDDDFSGQIIHWTNLNY